MKNDDLIPMLAERVCYDSESGNFWWKDVTTMPNWWRAKYAGKKCGRVMRGYVQICVTSDGKEARVMAHRLAFFIANGRAPVGEVDHINGNPMDNSAGNLRDSLTCVNQRNRKLNANNKSGVCGVYLQRGRWHAQVAIGGVHQYLGLFDSLQTARMAVSKFREKHGFSERHGTV